MIDKCGIYYPCWTVNGTIIHPPPTSKQGVPPEFSHLVLILELDLPFEVQDTFQSQQKLVMVIMILVFLCPLKDHITASSRVE